MDRQGRRLAKRLNVRRSVRLSETWPLPIGVCNRRQYAPLGDQLSHARTARGPLRAILFFLMLSIAASGIAVLPSLRIGSTLMGSQAIGVCFGGCQHFFLSSTQSAPDERKLVRQRTDLGGGEDVLDGNGNLGANAVALDQADGVATLQTDVSCIARPEELLSRCCI